MSNENSNSIISAIDLQLHKIRCCIEGHKKMVSKYSLYNKIMEIPVLVVLTVTASTSISPIDECSTIYKWVNFALSSGALCLQVVRKYCDFEKLIALHDTNAKSYMQIVHTTEANIMRDDGSLESIRAIHKELSDQLCIIEKYDVEIPEDTLEEIKKTIPNTAIMSQRRRSIEKMKENSPSTIVYTVDEKGSKEPSPLLINLDSKKFSFDTNSISNRKLMMVDSVKFISGSRRPTIILTSPDSEQQTIFSAVDMPGAKVPNITIETD